MLDKMPEIPKRHVGRPKTLPLMHGTPPAEALASMPYLEKQLIGDSSVIGNIDEATKQFLDGNIESATREAALRFASMNHSVIGGPRILAWFFKVEEMGMQGNLKAFELLLDRAFGRVTETIAVAHGEFDGMKDGELLKELERIKVLKQPKK